MNKTTVLIVIAVVVALGGWLFWQSTNKNANQSMTGPQPTQTTQTPTAAPSEEAKMTGEIKEINMEMGGFYFKPNKVTIKKGEKVKINFTNAGGIHDFTIDELNVKTNKINTGEITSVEFTADKAGTYEYYCSVGNHRQMGMKGTLVVE